MLTGFKIRIHPTDEQIKKFYQYAGTSRFMYNWALQAMQEAYDAGIKFKDLKLSNQLTIVQKEVEELQWLNTIVLNFMVFYQLVIFSTNPFIQ